MQSITLRSSVALASLLAVAGAAHAQNALGGGDALSRDTRHSDPRRTSNVGVLDANTRVGGSGDNGQAAKVDYYSRNLIVTGDVGGGREFRGSVGYREQSEFTGQTGSDENRFWRAYSVYSSPYMAQSNYNPLQASQNFGAVMYTRTYSNASARDILTNQQPLDARIAFDRFTADGGKKMKRQADIIDPANTRDVGERLNWRVTQAISQAAGRSERDEIALDDTLAGLGLSTFDRQRLKQDILQGRTKRELLSDPLARVGLVAGDSLADSARVRPQYSADYQSILESLRARAGDRLPEKEAGPDRAAEGKKEVEKALGEDMDWLRGQLIRSGVESGATGAEGPRGEAGPTKPSEAGAGKAPAERGGTAEGEAPAEGKAGKPTGPNIDDLAYILRHGRKLQSLVPEDSGAIRDMMQLAAGSMAGGEFFRAEERFASVLAVLPNNAGALAGVANAQLAAGIHASAALSLRKLFAMHPEMIDTHLGAEVLPPPARLESALAAARERLAAAEAPGASADFRGDRFDFGLLIAYVGFQTDRSDVIRQGLDAMRAARPGDALLAVLERVWLPQAADPTRPDSPSVR